MRNDCRYSRHRRYSSGLAIKKAVHTDTAPLDSRHVHSVCSGPGVAIRTITGGGRRLNRMRSGAYFRCDGSLLRQSIKRGSASSPCVTIEKLVSGIAIDVEGNDFGVVNSGTRIGEFDPRIIRDRARRPDWGWAVDRGRRIQSNERPRNDR